MQPSWEADFKEEPAIALGTLSQAQGDEITENHRRNVEERLEQRRIGDEVKAAVKQVVTKELATLVEEWFDDILSTLHNRVQSGVRLVEFKVVGQVRLDFLRKMSS